MRLLPVLLAVLALCAAPAAPAASPDAPGSLVLLLGSENVRQKLGLTSLQRAVLQSLREEYRIEAAAITANHAPTPEGRREAQRQLDELTRGFNNRALTVLNNRQRNLLGKIQHDVLGGLMLTQPSVQRQLDLSPQQIARINGIGDRLATASARLNRACAEGRITPGRRLAELRVLRLRQAAAMEAVLTPDQRQALFGMRGQTAS